MMYIYDLFDVPMPLVAPKEKRSSKGENDMFRDYENKDEKKKYNFQRKESIKKVVCCRVARASPRMD